jgi:hypothetical protein
LLIKVAIELLTFLVEIPLDASTLQPNAAPDFLLDSSIFGVPSHSGKRRAEFFDSRDPRPSLNAIRGASASMRTASANFLYLPNHHRRKNAACKENPL